MVTAGAWKRHAGGRVVHRYAGTVGQHPRSAPHVHSLLVHHPAAGVVERLGFQENESAVPAAEDQGKGKEEIEESSHGNKYRGYSRNTVGLLRRNEYICEILIRN